MCRAVLLCVWLVVVVGAAAGTSLANDRWSLSRRGGWSRRYCSCHDKGSRANRTYQTCVFRKGSSGGLFCKSETIPFLDPWYRYNPGVQGVFKVFNNPMPFYDAENFCDEEGARLTVPLSSDGMESIYSRMKDERESRCLLGIADRRVEGTFVDPDGSRPPYLPWAKNRPHNVYNKDCVVIHQPRAIEDVPCYYTAMEFVCERRMFAIPNGYIYDCKQWRFYKFYSDERTHASARRRCQEDRGTLAAFESWPDARVVRRLLHKSRSDLVWVDYTDETRDRRFVTSTGMYMDDTDYINWNPDQPDNYGGAQYCVAIRKTGEYFDEDCNMRAPYLCQIKIF